MNEKELNLPIESNEENIIKELTGERNIQYCSFKPENENDQITLYKALNSDGNALSDMINMTISLKHVFCEIIEIVDQKTGELKKVPRCVIIDEKGESYGCISKGVFSSLKRMFQIFGTPDTWEKPKKVKIVQVTRGTNKMLSLEMAVK